ncbi:hypothetical protein ACFSTI_26925 [Rhizorhabdus histidinilytica]
MIVHVDGHLYGVLVDDVDDVVAIDGAPASSAHRCRPVGRVMRRACSTMRASRSCSSMSPR